MGKIQEFMIGIFILLIVLIAGATIYSDAIAYGGYTSYPDFPLVNQSQSFRAEAQNYTNTIQQSFEQGQSAGAFESAYETITNGGQAVVQTALLTFSGLNLVVEMAGVAVAEFDSVFPGVSWIVGILIAIMSLYVIYALVSGVMRFDL